MFFYDAYRRQQYARGYEEACRLTEREWYDAAVEDYGEGSEEVSAVQAEIAKRRKKRGVETDVRRW